MNALSLAEVEAVAQLWNSGATMSEIIEKTGRSKSSISYMRREHDALFASRRNAGDSEELIAKAASLWNSGLKLDALAQELGIGTHQLRGMITRNAERFAERDLRHSAWRRTISPASSAGTDTLRKPAGRTDYQPGLDDLSRAGWSAQGGASLAPLTLLDLTDRTCRWPIAGEGAATRFCGYCIPAGKIYCETHRARSREGGR